MNLNDELAAWGEPPAGPDEEALAEFAAAALDHLDRGEPIDRSTLPTELQHLARESEQVLDDIMGLCKASLSVHEHLGLLTSGGGEDRPDPFPDEFRLQRSLGTGSFGEVWLAEDLNLKRLVALKTLRIPSGSATRDEARAILRNDAEKLASVRHPNIVQVYAWRESGSKHYLVLQYVSGGSLAERVKGEGPLPWQQAVRYIADVAEGLQEVHARGIIHRDVKPGNILWDPAADEAVLTDFGIAARLSDVGTAAGTRRFMAPEAFDGVVSPALDVFGLAASLFWLVTGKAPFPAPDLHAMLRQVEAGLPEPDPRQKGVPEAVEQVLRGGLDARADRRLGLADFAARLRASLNLLLADTLTLPAGQPVAGVNLKLVVSRLSGTGTHAAYVPVATSQPLPSRVLRDLKRVPRTPERIELHTGDRVRVEIEADQPGHVTVFNVGPTGNLNLLYFDAPGSPCTAFEARRPLHILDVQLTPPAGRERLFAVWSCRPLPLRLDELRTIVGRSDAAGSVPYRATRDMIHLSQSLDTLPPEDRHVVVLELDHQE